MTYSPNIPISSVSPKSQQAQLQTNFSQYGSIFSNNHVAMNLANQGDHKAIIFQQQGSDAIVSDDYVVLYSKSVTNTLGTSPQLFMRIPQFLPTKIDTNNAPNNPMQISYNQVNTSGPMYQSFLPGGLVFYFGTISAAPGSFPQLITLTPICSSILSVIVLPNSILTAPTGGGVPTSANILTSNTFNLYAQSTGFVPNPINVSWMAIGMQ